MARNANVNPSSETSRPLATSSFAVGHFAAKKGLLHSPRGQLCSKSREQLEGKVKIWKKAIEEKKAALLLCEEIRRKQISTGDEDNMDIAVNLQIDEEALKNYESFSETGYKLFKKVMGTACENLCDSFYTEE